MNRAQRRKSEKQHSKKTFNIMDFQKAVSIAVEMKRSSQGHLFSKTLKERCVFCGVTTKTKKKCDYWFMTFIDRLQMILINPDFFKNDEIEALWVQHGDEYQDVKIPINLEK